MSAASVDSMQISPASSAAPTIISYQQAPRAASNDQASRPDQAISATGASAPPSALPQGTPARGQPSPATTAQSPLPVGTITVTRPDQVTAASARARAPFAASAEFLPDATDSNPSAVILQASSSQPPQPAGTILVSRPDLPSASSAGAAAVGSQALNSAAGMPSTDTRPSQAAGTQTTPTLYAPSSPGVRSFPAAFQHRDLQFSAQNGYAGGVLDPAPGAVAGACASEWGHPEFASQTCLADALSRGGINAYSLPVKRKSCRSLACHVLK